MTKVTTFAGLAMLGAAAAWGADYVVEGSTGDAVTLAAFEADGTLELKWDNGTRRWSIAWYTGAGAWVGNDFDVSTLKWAHAAISKFKFYTRGAWPNGRWDGIRIGFYDFSASVPGSLLWPTSGSGYFFKPSASIQGHIWVECDINWTCPSVKFLAAEEQFYNYPNCDPFSLDNNTTFRRHSWKRSSGTWSPFENSSTDPYRNVMIRVFVDDETVNVAPTSLGRVKALYY